MIGIYFLKLDSEIVYVGQSIDIHNRVKQHKDKEFDDYETTECAKENLNSLEAHYILVHNPILNKMKYEIIVCGIPKKSKNCGMKSISIRFPDETKEELEKAAKKDGRSLNSFVVRAVKDKIESDKKDKR